MPSLSPGLFLLLLLLLLLLARLSTANGNSSPPRARGSNGVERPLRPSARTERATFLEKGGREDQQVIEGGGRGRGEREREEKERSWTSVLDGPRLEVAEGREETEGDSWIERSSSSSSSSSSGETTKAVKIDQRRELLRGSGERRAQAAAVVEGGGGGGGGGRGEKEGGREGRKDVVADDKETAQEAWMVHCIDVRRKGGREEGREGGWDMIVWLSNKIEKDQKVCKVFLSLTPSLPPSLPPSNPGNTLPSRL